GAVSGTVVDVGVGEGLGLERVLAGPALRPQRVVGVEYRYDKAQVARRVRNLDVAGGGAGRGPLRGGGAGLLLWIEVAGDRPHVGPAVAELARVTARATGRCVVSVPWEPWFCLGNLGRGKNLRRLGNDPEHIRWFTPSRLRRTLEPHFEEIEVVRAFPWLVGV